MNIDQLPDDLTPLGGCPACNAAFTEICKVDSELSVSLICYSGHLVLVTAPFGGAARSVRWVGVLQMYLLPRS